MKKIDGYRILAVCFFSFLDMSLFLYHNGLLWCGCYVNLYKSVWGVNWKKITNFGGKLCHSYYIPNSSNPYPNQITYYKSFSKMTNEKK